MLMGGALRVCVCTSVRGTAATCCHLSDQGGKIKGTAQIAGGCISPAALACNFHRNLKSLLLHGSPVPE